MPEDDLPWGEHYAHLRTGRLSDKQLALVVISLHHCFRAALRELVAARGPHNVIELKARLIREMKDAVPSGLSIDDEAEATRLLLGLIENSIIFTDDQGGKVE